jgi:ribosomal protein L4
MATVEIVNKERKGTGTVELPDSIFGAEVKTHLMHHVVTAKLAAARA